MKTKNNSSAKDLMPQLHLDSQLCFALYSTSLAMTKVYKPLLAELELTYPQYVVMLVLWENDGLMVSEIGERLFLDSGTLTPLLKRLESGGFITRVRDTADERRVHIKLTAAGRTLKKKAGKIPACLVTLLQCDVKEILSLTQDLRTLRERLMA
ncbi:DNA-binding MarR family transcriptional regulator [Oxalobacteraceae bacterium GrIS 2.11]